MRDQVPEPHTLAGAYAMDALDGQDRARFERHLERCEECTREVAGLHEALVEQQHEGGATCHQVRIVPVLFARARTTVIRVSDQARAEGDDHDRNRAGRQRQH